MKEKKLKLYYAQWADDDETTIAVIAYDIKQAIKMARGSEMIRNFFAEGCWEFIDLKCHWAKLNKQFDGTKYKEPFVAECNDDDDIKQYIKDHIYGGCQCECEECHVEDICYYDEETNKILCSECEDKLIEERQNKPKEVDTA